MGEPSSKQKARSQAALRLLEGQPDDYIPPAGGPNRELSVGWH